MTKIAWIIPAIIVALVFIKWIPLWLGILLLIVIFGMRAWARHKLLTIFERAFWLKAQALAGALVEVHAVEPAAAPPLDEDTGDGEMDDEMAQARAGMAEDFKNLAWYNLDVTIIPTDDEKQYTHWEPDELLIMPFDAEVETLDDLDECEGVYTYSIEQDGEFVEDEIGKWEGAQRLRMLVGVPRQWDHCKFAYYTEAFGEIWLKRSESAP